MKLRVRGIADVSLRSAAYLVLAKGTTGVNSAEAVELVAERPVIVASSRHDDRRFLRPRGYAPATSLAASWIRSTIAAGCEASDAWLASSSIVFRGPIRSAIRRSLSGWIMRSAVET